MKDKQALMKDESIDSPLVTERRLSVVVPANNEAAGIGEAIDSLSGVLERCAKDWEIIAVDDGSEDDTYEIVREAARKDQRVRGIRFTRNFGKEAAILAGLRRATGDGVITIDGDMQHPVTLIPDMVEAWNDGAKVVSAEKRRRTPDSVVARFRAGCFNSIASRLTGVEIRNSSDFKLLDREVVDVMIHELPERQRFYRGLSEWVGYRDVKLHFDVQERSGGEGKWSFLKLADLAVTALVSFTSAPLRLVTIMGLLTLLLGFIIAVDTVISLFRGIAVSGFATIILTLLIIGSFIMISLGILGEYIAKIYEEIKQRPVYLIEDTTDPE
ncbi:MAG TPA: glycosyltransferase family 2 protein [Gammaproteobacteria bacterium]|jgi:glycosyltransferase involved in cell wall biosynthesis|nr:glycosyltransferase family 2 protein [Gammaproteobacteria bacterium]